MDSWNFGAPKAVSAVEIQQVGISWAAHVAYSERGAKDDFAKAEVGLVFQLWLFQPRSVSDLLDGGWFGHQQVCFSF